MTINPDWFNIVGRTAKHGFIEANESDIGFQKWLAIWALDVVGEAIEWQKEPSHEELGDLLWGIAASAMLMGVEQCALVYGSARYVVSSSTDYQSIVYECAAYGELAKKTARDGRDLEPLKEQLAKTLAYVRTLHDETLNIAIAAVDKKLKARYPDGFDTERSINRVG